MNLELANRIADTINTHNRQYIEATDNHGIASKQATALRIRLQALRELRRALFRCNQLNVAIVTTHQPDRGPHAET